MRWFHVAVLLLLFGTGLVLGLVRPPTTPRAATPVSRPEVDVLATRVTDLEATVDAQTVAQLELGLRVDDLEQSVVPLLEALPEQAVLTDFLQGQINDLQVRVDTLEAPALASPSAADEHELVGSWAVVDDESGGAPGLLTLMPDGTVVIIAPGGRSAVGVWAPTGHQSAVGVWVYAGGARGMDVVAVRAIITLGEGGETISLVYEVLEITPRGSVAERSDGTATGARIVFPPSAPAPAATQAAP